MKNYIETVLGPRLQGDGGWVEYVSQTDDVVTLIFRGECSKCDILDRCSRWMEMMIEQNLGEHIRINVIRKRPYFQDRQ